jgi:pimeloyl-ACP methyl ester carboxylesterase
MRRCLAAVCLAAAALVLAARGGESADPAEEEAGPAETAWSLVGDLPMPTMGGMQFWADELFFHRWRIQRNVLTGHYRLLDGNSLRHASGTYEHCRAKLEQIKRDRSLPPMQGKAVVVLHGLADTRLSTARLCKHLEQNGGYTVFNVAYPSTRESIGNHARTLAKIIQNLDGIEELSFVGHSMGNIVIRRYLADRTDATTGERPGPPVKRFVMLGPPNHGSSLAVRLGDERLFTTVLGKPGQELGRQWTWLESDLAVPQCEFGIIAGGLGNEQGFNPLIPGDDDGVVAVASTRLAGASDFVMLPVLHPLLPAESRVIEYTLRFLDQGHFVSADGRRPVGE